MCRWRVSGSAVVLEYSGVEPPVLFAIGPVHQLRTLFDQIQPGRYQYTLKDPHYEAIKSQLSVEVETRMWRMVLDRPNFAAEIPHAVRRLKPADAHLLQALFANQSEGPDSYHPSQLENPGVFYGAFADDQLVAVAGTHIVSPVMSVAAIGNIFTHPAWRGRGLCAQVTQAVSAHLVREGLDLIVLNVSASNNAALHCYEKVGFLYHCQYLEGIGLIP